MPSNVIQLCDGFASHRLFEDGRIEVNGAFPTWQETARLNKVVSIWERFGEMIEAAQAESGVPAAWLVGIMFIESGGDINACSPCIQHDNAGNQICAFAPNCGGNCCAYGLMQFIDTTARAYGATGPSLLGNPQLSILIAGRYFKELLRRSGGDPILAAKRYNGGGWSDPCSSQAGTFGIGGQGDYPMNFARSVNTFIQLNLPSKSRAEVKLRELPFVFAAFTVLGYVVSRKYDIMKYVGKL